MSARYSTSTCRHCLGSGCLHCDHRGYFSKRLRRRGEMAELRKLLELPPQNVIALPVIPKEAA
jgi:hypothetical protein